MATEVLRRIIVSCPDYELLWAAKNGAEAIMYCNHQLPDLILMDLIMPVMDGVEATRRIMKQTPCAILIVTASVTGNSSMVFEAMGVGALDVVATPALSPHLANSSVNELIRKIQIIAKLTDCDREKGRTTQDKSGFKQKSIRQSTLIAIGASTGGPKALAVVLSSLPKNFPASIVVIQHMDKKFSLGLAEWLGQQISLPVSIIVNGDRPQKSTIKIPTTDNHLIMSKTGTLNYTVDPLDNFYHPSLDVFFHSISTNWYGKIIGVVLTGMGKDGASGLLAIKEKGHHTIVQDEASSVVYGMPKAAAANGSAKEILPLDKIGPQLLSIVSQSCQSN
jgi:chemotaxis response regulator CheB